jgi:alkylation response protein AidB-like acyl-CoA dehydrogenase
VDFRLSEDQRALRDGVRSFCEGRVPVERLRELERAPGLDRALQAELAEMGVFSLRLPESEGGVGLGSADAVLVFAELGRRLVPGPLAWTHLAAGLVDGAADGRAIVGGLDALGPDAGGPVLVEHLASLDSLLVLRPDGVWRVDPRALAAEAAPVATPLDPLTPLHHVARLPRGERLAGAEAAARLRREGALLVSAQQLGIAESTLELAVAYAKQREQFGRIIGAFQAVKHILADMFVRQEAARAAVYAAGATLDHPEVGDPERAVAAAKLVAGEAAHENARACIQVHGGMGYTWEVPAHYFLKRAFVLETCFGTGEEQAARVGERLDAGA